MIIAHTPADVNQLRGEIKSSRKTDERGGEYYEDEDMQSKKKIPLRLNDLRKISKRSFSDQFCNSYLNWNNFPKPDPNTFGPVNKIFLNQE